ncbi:DMT family transporter [Pelosinus sp. sgz500959]|uniref:DMT family transporter n=1 Tax=Pelosinus sp. sgz500959 TaxID=3242472 RepID=UPI0036727F3B
MNQQHLGALLVLTSATGFATLPIFIKIAYTAGANTLTVLTLRFMLAALFLWIILRPLGISPNITFKNIIKLSLMGIVGYGSMSFFFATSLQYLSASLAEMLLFTYPVIVTILSFAMGHEQFTWPKGIALLICIVGLFLILGVSLTNISQLGVALGLGSAIVYSCYIMISKSVLKNIHSLVATTYVCSAAALVFAAYTWKTDQLILTLPTTGWLALLGIALFGTIVGILGFFAGISKMGVSNASIISTAEPVIAVLLSVLMLGEHLTLLQAVGGLLIVTSILVLQLCTNPTIELAKSPYQLSDSVKKT